MATRPWSWRTPDARLRDIKYARDLEEERTAQLDEQDNQRLLGLQAEMETEQARSADLDRRDGIQEEMRFEQKRAADLDVAGAPQYEPGGRVLPAEAAPWLREMLPRWQRETPYLGPEGQEYQPLLGVPGEPMYEPTGGLIPTDVSRRMTSGVRAAQQMGPTPWAPGNILTEMLRPLEQADYPRRLIKEKLIEPAVPDFALKIPGEVVQAAMPPGARDVVGAIGAIGGPAVPDVTITDEFVEEAASWILDPLNLFPVVGWGPDLVRAANAARKGAPAALRTLLKNPQARSFLDDAIRAGERGGPRVPGGRFRPTAPEGIKLTNDLPTTTAIRQRLADIDAELAKPSVKGGRPAMLTERARLQAQADIDEILASGLPVEEQFKAVEAELEGLRIELQTRGLPFRGRWTSRKFVPQEKDMPMGGLSAEERAAHPSAAQSAASRAARAEQRYPGLSTGEMNARERVYAEFVKNAKFEPVEEPLVGRARFTPEGETIREPTYATEGELGGVRARQGELGIGPGERPIETAGPMFEGGPPREPPKPPTALAGEPPEGPLQTGLAKIKEYVAQSRRVQPGVEAARHEERLVRINKFLVERDRLIAGGVPVDEAISRATAKWRGKYPSETFAAVDLAPEEIDAFWRVLVDHPMAFEQDRALKALARGMRGDYIPPNEDALLRRLWGDDFADVVTATPGKAIQAAGRPSFLTQVIEEALNALLIPMHVMSSMDFSWGGRQMRMLLGGGFIGPRKGRLPITLRMPREWAKAVWEPIVGMTKKEEVILARDAALKADKTPIRVWTEDGFTDIPFGRVWDEMARGRKPIPGTKEANLAGVAGREERAPSSLVARVPGIKQSQQGFTLGINQGHHQILKDALLLEMEAGRKLTPEGVRAMGNFFNRVVGRGELGGTWVAKLARGFFWAPGLRLAFWQSAFNLAHKNPAVRAQARKYLAGYLGLGLSVMGLADLTGAGEVTWDPRNSDFGKINIKGIRFNVWGPDVVATRYLMQSIFGEAVSPLTGKYKVDWKEQLVRYSRSGAQPLVGFGIDIAEGKTFIGEEFTWTDWERWLPLAGQDVKDAWDLKGMPWGPVAAAITAPIAALGFGVQSYDKPEDRLARQYNEYVDQGKFGKDALYYADEDGLTVRANVQKFADLAKLDTERNILARMENNEIKAEKEEYYSLPDLAKRFNAGESALGPEIMSKFREYKHDVHVAMDARTWGVDFGPESEDEKLLNAWMSINPHDEKYADPVTGQPDYNLVDIDSDAAKAALEKANPRLAKAVEEIISSLDPELAKLEPDLEEALRLRSDLYDTPRWTGVSPAKQREIEGLQELTDQFRDRLAAAGLDPGPVTVSQYQDAARQGGLDPGLAFVAWPLRGGDTEARSQDPAYLKFLFDNQAKLAIFFPELYDSRATLRFLEPDIQEAVIAAGAR